MVKRKRIGAGEDCRCRVITGVSNTWLLGGGGQGEKEEQFRREEVIANEAQEIEW